MAKGFAPEYTRNENSLVIFPRDTDLRSLILPSLDPTEHIAKANMHMVKALVEFVSEPGETILDPFAGTGTILVAATMGRKVTCIEIEEHFQQIIERSIKAMKQSIPDIDNVATLIPGDCSKLLPWPDIADHMIFSPPYANLLRKKGKMDRHSITWGYGSATDYTSHPDNVGNLNTFFYHQKMEQIYKKFYQSLVPGGTMTIIIKDRMEAGKRIHLGKRAARDCQRMGFELLGWNRWLALGGAYSAYNRSIGLETVDEEDLVTLRKP